MICLVQVLYYETNGEHLECCECPFRDSCAEVEDGFDKA